MDEGQIKLQFPSLRNIQVSTWGDETKFFDRNGVYVAAIEDSGSDHVLVSEYGHIHRSSFKAALELLVLLLQGEGRWAQLYRADTLAIEWVELREGDGFSDVGTTIYLCPFDEDEWRLRRGERWTVVRTTWGLLADGTLRSTRKQRREAAPLRADPEMTTWISSALGPPIDGMKWVTGSDRRVVTQAPRGWRVANLNPESDVLDYAPEQEGVVLRIRQGYRDADEPREDAKVALHPSQVEFKVAFALKNAADWRCDRWSITFLGARFDTLVILELCQHLSSSFDASPIRARIASAAQETRYAPLIWHMGSELIRR